ncbi:AAA family ATPase [Mesorhizobium newzealandense]|uniref:AAA family ATPase n=1 Tax=Mesorhizobium newzealandense TaxID=1300302 RepID=A0ABW4UIT7_9HYPH
MNESGFREWLRTNYKPNTVSTKLHECRNLAAAYGDLDEHYDADRLDGVMQALAYTAQDRAADRPNPSKLSITSDLYRDLSNYRTAINYYRNFRQGASRRGGNRRPDIDAVHKAMNEYDALGFDEFMEAYNFGSGISYWVLRDGKRYPSKAIFGVAHQFMPNGAPLDNEGCSGTDARKHLESLGFEIQTDDGQSTSHDRSRRYWIEKTLVTGRLDREQGEHSLGRALWSPQRSKSGGDIYSNMRAVQPGDVVFHLTDNEAITGVSIASDAVDDSFQGLAGTDWEGAAYRVALRDYEALVPTLDRSAFLATEPFATELSELAKSGAKGLFYNAHRGLNQGAYLTEATPTLLSILNRAYQAFAGQSLPHVDEDVVVSSAPAATGNSYTLDDALEELFLDRAEAEQIMLLWQAKRNIILQGPPGVGKSFAAQRLAFALMGATDRDRLGFVQFHQSYSYEDFVEGYRPTAEGFELRPGKFVEFCRRAEADPQNSYVFVIDEINRGNLSKILGELMLLIEADKRSPDWAMALASGKVPFHVPGNVYLLGLMNTADRSLAVVDYALRRRFAFVDLVPKLNSPKFRSQLDQAGVSHEVINALIMRVDALNDEIASDTTNLGRGFEIGHSFFCSYPWKLEDGWIWYERVIRTEILHLLREYWFDAPGKVAHWESELLAPL